MHTVVKHDPSIAACKRCKPVRSLCICVSGQRRNFPGAAIFPRKYGRYVQLERQDFLGNFVSATIFPSDRFFCDTGLKSYCCVAHSGVGATVAVLLHPATSRQRQVCVSHSKYNCRICHCTSKLQLYVT